MALSTHCGAATCPAPCPYPQPLRGLSSAGVAPAVRGLVAEQPSGLLDREQRFVFPEVAAHLDVRIELFDQGRVRSGCDGVCVGNDEYLGSGEIGLECQTDGLRAVSGIDVAPQVPLAR